MNFTKTEVIERPSLNELPGYDRKLTLVYTNVVANHVISVKYFRSTNDES